jgi:predicted dehydrogenase
LVVAAARTGARIVLIGSPRGVTRDLPLADIRAKQLRLVGAHVETLAYEDRPGFDARRAEAERFLELLAAGELRVDDLVGQRVDPREADSFYRDLARSRDVLAARFDWTSLAAEQRVSSARFARLPDLRARGAEVGRPSLSNRSVDDDPFAGAVGMLRVGMVGCGDIAVHNARAVEAAPNSRLAACYDPAAELAEDLARAHGVEATATLDALLDRADVDAVFIAVPHHLHGPLAAQAAAAGKHIIVEKPLAHTLAAAVDLAAVAERAGVTLSVCFPHRYDPSARHARSLVAEGALGELAGTLVNFFAEKPPSYWLGGFSGRATSTWRASRAQAGGGVLIMNLSHVLDEIRYITGAEVEQCSAVMRVTDGPAEIEDTISMTLRYASGAVGSLMASSALRGHRGGKTELHVWGNDGYLIVEPDLQVYTSRAAATGIRTTQWQRLAPETSVDARAVYISRFASALERGDEPDVTVGDAIAVQAIIESAYRSADTGETVHLPELLSEVRA